MLKTGFYVEDVEESEQAVINSKVISGKPDQYLMFDNYNLPVEIKRTNDDYYKEKLSNQNVTAANFGKY